MKEEAVNRLEDNKMPEERIIEALKGEIRVSGETKHILTMKAELSLLQLKMVELEEEILGDADEDELDAAVEPLARIIDRLLVTHITYNSSSLNDLIEYGI